MKLRLNISPCPNDTFMFEAMLAGRIDCEGLEFDVHFADIEELNAMAQRGVADVSKLSCAVLPQVVGAYKVLDSGSALGRGNGPLMVSLHEVSTSDAALRIAVPGAHTTANMLVDRLFPQLTRRGEVLFSQIADAVCSGEYAAGVLIHEGRFTYASRGLHLVADLGAEWERVSGLPLPLGAIVVRSSLESEVQRRVERVLRRSVEYAMANPDASAEFVRCHAQELSPQVMRNHIELFVNDFSVSLGTQGRQALSALTRLNSDEIFVK